MKAVFGACARSTADVRAVLHSMNPTEVIAASYLEVVDCLHTLPAIVEWQ
jgi:hypothetical protein